MQIHCKSLQDQIRPKHIINEKDASYDSSTSAMKTTTVKKFPFLILQFSLGFAISILILDWLPVKSWLFDLIFLFFGVQVTEEESRSTVVWVNTFIWICGSAPLYLHFIWICGWTPSYEYVVQHLCICISYEYVVEHLHMKMWLNTLAFLWHAHNKRCWPIMLYENHIFVVRKASDG